MVIRAVWFDIGETLLDETNVFGAWADWLDVPRHTFSAVFGAILARGGDLLAVFEHFRPDFDLDAALAARAADGTAERLTTADLYPDARPSLQALRDAGFFVGLAGNQTEEARRALATMDLPCDRLATSAEWGVEKPDPAFFDRIAELSDCPRDQIAYVGDRLDNDIAPAARAGLVPVWLRRGPWGHILNPDTVGLPAITVNSLNELVTTLTANPR